MRMNQYSTTISRVHMWPTFPVRIYRKIFVGETLGLLELLIPSHRALEGRRLLDRRQDFAEAEGVATPSDS